MSKEWKMLSENDGIDMCERHAIERENRKSFDSNAEKFSKELNNLYKEYISAKREYDSLSRLFIKFGYSIEEGENGIKVWKSVYNPEEK